MSVLCIVPDHNLDPAELAKIRTLHPGKYVAVNEQGEVLNTSGSLDEVFTAIQEIKGRVSIVTPQE